MPIKDLIEQAHQQILNPQFTIEIQLYQNILNDFIHILAMRMMKMNN